MNRPRLPRALFVAILLVLVIVVLYVNAINLWEAYGSGPPHYGRTTNMDKWANPWPALLILDGLAIAVCLLLYRLRLRARSQR
ncbi:Uncharacterised protein [Bordetella ansorpii]|uniref:Integral membrane protein n=1 Tax=Bordetella ansorpii TaxID=288768 RepID=A0A157SRP7_9BORD|nr:hypothetical protein [Bordetella ansorpii]SAI73112.1 Uncharacterised protein [Bordetella ansorpii]